MIHEDSHDASHAGLPGSKWIGLNGMASTTPTRSPTYLQEAHDPNVLEGLFTKNKSIKVLINFCFYKKKMEIDHDFQNDDQRTSEIMPEDVHLQHR
jgi:hypothetical protein